MPTRTRKPTLMQRLTLICSQHGWQCGLARVPCDAPQSPQNTGVTVARNNAVVVWSDEQIETRLRELEAQG